MIQERSGWAMLLANSCPDIGYELNGCPFLIHRLCRVTASQAYPIIVALRRNDTELATSLAKTAADAVFHYTNTATYIDVSKENQS